MKFAAFIVCFLVTIQIGNIDKVKSSYERAVSEATEDYENELLGIREKYIRIAEKNKKIATRGARLDEAVEWRDWIAELDSKSIASHGKNILKHAKLSASNSNERMKEKVEYIVDGIVPEGIPLNDRRFWFGIGGNHRDGWWIKAEWNRSVEIGGLRFVCPKGRKWTRGGHEPIRYLVIMYRRGKEHKTYSFNKHPKEKLFADGKATVVDINFPRTRCDSMRFLVTEVTGNNDGPVIWEMEVFGR